MVLYEDIYVLGNWFILKFIENDGMAFGLDLPGNHGKLILTIFRIVAVTAIGLYLRHLIRIKSPAGLIISVSLIFAGAMGNIIDSVFYGVIFSASTQFSTATFLPEGGGYAPWMHGHVVDIFYFPILKGYWPEWVPLKGGDYFEFFRPVFNIADSAITTGVFLILIFQKRFFLEEEHVEKQESSEN
jgi:signal peptidase II